MIFPFLKFRKQKKPCIAQGPSIKHAPRWQATFFETKFSIAAPYSNMAGYEPDRSPRGRYKTDNHSRAYGVSRWRDACFLNRQYRYWGPWGVGKVNTMSCSAWFSQPQTPGEGTSLFHPRYFEFAVIDYIDDNFTNLPAEDLKVIAPNSIRAPINWQVFKHLPGPAACFYVDTGTTSTHNYYFVTALDDHDLIFLAFSLEPNHFGPKNIPPEDWVDMRNMKQLMLDMFNSLEITLSPDVEARRQRAIKDMDDPSLRKTMDTHTFHTHPEEVKQTEPQKAINKK